MGFQLEMLMSIPDEDIVREVLSVNGRGQTLRSAVLEAWDAVQKLSNQNPWWRRKATRAALMWEHSVQQAINGLAGDKGLTVVPHHDTTSFVFDDKVLLRMKKANIQLISSNFPTPLAESYHRHDSDLFGFDGHQRVELCHVFNRFKTKIDWVGVVARNVGSVLWHIDLDWTETKVVPLPLPKTGSAADVVVKPLLPDNKKDSSDGAA
jgi:hypothetical protein